MYSMCVWANATGEEIGAVGGSKGVRIESKDGEEWDERKWVWSRSEAVCRGSRWTWEQQSEAEEHSLCSPWCLSASLFVSVCMSVPSLSLPAWRFVWKCLNTHQYACRSCLLSFLFSNSTLPTPLLSAPLSPWHCFPPSSFLVHIFIHHLSSFISFSSLQLHLTFPSFPLTLTSRLPLYILTPCINRFYNHLSCCNLTTFMFPGGF